MTIKLPTVEVHYRSDGSVHARTWLNPLSSGDSGLAEVTIEPTSLFSSKSNIVLTLRDCEDTVNLDFSVAYENTAEARLHKVRLLQQMLNLIETELLRQLPDTPEKS